MSSENTLNKVTIDKDSTDTSSSFSENSLYEHNEISAISILGTPAFIILSTITGVVILTNSYSNYNLTEATAMSALGTPFIMFYITVTYACCENYRYMTYSRLFLSLTFNSAFSSLIGYAIYNKFNESEIKIEQMAAASAIGSATLMIASYSAYGCLSLGKNIFGEKRISLNDNNNKLDGYHSIENDLESELAQI
ncbi:MAG: hypothetical protein VX335_01180 [Pseudomonadota bacterium]|nr:hypothetical protein [Pseudomonadota bacterium]